MPIDHRVFTDWVTRTFPDVVDEHLDEHVRAVFEAQKAVSQALECSETVFPANQTPQLIAGQPWFAKVRLV